MKRSRSLHVWLGLALALVVAAPALAGAGTWAAVGSWQSGRENHRERQAMAALKGLRLTDPAQRDAVTRRLMALGVDAQLGPNGIGADVSDAVAVKLALGGKPVLMTSAVKSRSRRGLAHDHQLEVALPNVAGQLWVPRESAATRWAIALGVGFVALAAALVAVVALLRSWVLRPLARLAADADRIAGGELDVAPLHTRAREVADVGDALLGMAGGLRDALAGSAAAEHERRFMITAIAHDLRTPLFTLRGSLEALERGVGDGRYLDRARDKAAHLDRLVSDLFTFSRLEYTREAMAFDEVDVGRLTQRAVEGVEGQAAVRGCTVRIKDVNPRLVVRGDADALLRVVTNLLDNAIRHSRARVTVSARRVGGAVRVEICDDGSGFDPGDLPHVFEPLFRSDRARAAARGGAGLGLAIARRLARAHGGDVEAANDAAGGARTTVTLPPA
jgi:signal transduction histidine kinase